MHRVKAGPGVNFGGEFRGPGSLVDLSEHPEFKEGLLASGQLEDVAHDESKPAKKRKGVDEVVKVSEETPVEDREEIQAPRVERSTIGRLR